MERWGFSFEELRKLNDDITALSFPALGATGTVSREHAMGNTILGFAGFDRIFGFPGHDALELPTACSDDVNLWLRSKTGEERR